MGALAALALSLRISRNPAGDPDFSSYEIIPFSHIDAQCNIIIKYSRK